MSQFVHLHLHSQYSLLDGVNKVTKVVEQAHSIGQPAIAITDHGNMHGAVEFYDAAMKTGIKPIIGCELYVNPVSRHERKTKHQGGAPTHHLTVLAKNKKGYQNLCKLVTTAYREGFYFKPRVDHEILQEYSEGLVVLSGCLAGELNAAVEKDDIKAAKEKIEFYAGLFGENYYLEIQPHPIPEQRRLNSACIDLAKDIGVPLVATTDCHYPSEDHHFAQEVLMCISTGKNVHDPTRIKHDGVKLHLKSVDEMYTEFADQPCDEAIKNTLRIAEQCNLEFDFSTHYMPRYGDFDDKGLDRVMEKQARDGLKERLEQIKLQTGIDPDKAEYEARLDEELSLISKMGFPGYFLVVADFINWAKEQGIPVGPGRGSAAGSLVAYTMRITEVDPIFHKLLFERFLNPERISLPDIDVDFCIHGRDKVIQYVVEKYGEDKVAQIATFGTLKAKAAIKDVGRALGMSYSETDRIAQLIPAPRQGFDFSIDESIKMEKRLKDYANGEGKEHIQLALKLEGLTRHSSTHAAGVVIGDRPLDEMLPLMMDKVGSYVTQYSMKYVEKIGLVKFDFLGLKTLTVINTALKIIKESRGVDIDLNKLHLDDPKTYSLLCAGNSTGVFQLESSGITDMTMRLKPNCFNDLVATIALYRPGPLDAGMVDHYIKRKHGLETVVYLHATMKDTLSDTYGIILYQEQIMQLARELAGYSLSEADLLRRAMGKKVPAEMAKQRKRFLSGAIERNIPEASANEIFDQMETFARYGFNRSHSAAYAMISFQTAYLKAHYGVEFMAALMSNEMGDSDKTLKNFTECKKQGITVLPPDVNESLTDFTVIGGKIRFGLSAVKGVGDKAVEAVIEARQESGQIESLEDFATRVSLKAVNKKVIENLIKCGAFDSCGELSRRELLSRMEDVIRIGQSLQKDKDTNQMSLFGSDDLQVGIPVKTSHEPEWPVNKKLSFEKQAVGFYISGHPLDKYMGALKRLGTIQTTTVKNCKNKSQVRVAGVVTALKLKNTKKGDRYASFILEDSVGTVETLVWPDTYMKVAHILASDEPIIVSARADVSNERCTLIVDKMESLIALRDKKATQAVIRLSQKDNLSDNVMRLVDVFSAYVGNCPVKALIEHEEGNLSVLLRDNSDRPVCVQPSEELCDKVEQLFGRPVLSFL